MNKYDSEGSVYALNFQRGRGHAHASAYKQEEEQQWESYIFLLL